MGLIKAAAGAFGGTMADQWKEFFYCDAIDKDVLVVKGEKRVGGRSSNKKGSDNIISSGWNCCCRWSVYDHRRTGKGCGGLCRTRTVYL